MLQVPLGVQLYNENKLDEMAKILEEFHSYIPSIPSTQTVTLGDGTTRSVDNAQFFHILMGGDQLTVARARGTAALRATHDAPTERLSGIVPVVEDWHARLTLMKVCIMPLYKHFLFTVMFLRLYGSNYFQPSRPRRGAR